MVQMNKAIVLAKKTSQEFKDNCKHKFEREYAFGADTGDEACTICGKSRPRK